MPQNFEGGKSQSQDSELGTGVDGDDLSSAGEGLNWDGQEQPGWVSCGHVQSQVGARLQLVLV